MITDPMKANWAVAYAIEHRRRYLNPALRKAYNRHPSEIGALPDPDAMREALAAAQSIAAALERGLEMLGDADSMAAPSDPQRPETVNPHD